MTSISRRLFLRHTATAAAATAVSVPAVAPAIAEEDIHDRVDRLSWELADALNTYQDGNWYAQIYPSLLNDNPVGLYRATAKTPLTPDERIDAALAEIVAAFREKWPNCSVRVGGNEYHDSGMLLVLSDAPGLSPGQTQYLGSRRPVI